MDATRLLQDAARLVDDGGSPRSGTPPLRTGVDLGTATCVLVVVDAAGRPLWVDAHGSAALSDGVVVDFAAAIATVTRLRERAVVALGTDLESAVTAVPPGLEAQAGRACSYVVEQGGFAHVRVVDEITAANRVLQVTDGVVADVGGGSTGVGIFRGGRMIDVADRPGGGHHLDLILAGALGVDVAEAEKRKRVEGAEHIHLLRHGFERVAENIRVLSRGHPDTLPIHLAGGGCMVPGAADVIAAYLGRRVLTYPHPLLITPLGVALEDL